MSIRMFAAAAALAATSLLASTSQSVASSVLWQFDLSEVSAENRNAINGTIFFEGQVSDNTDGSLTVSLLDTPDGDILVTNTQTLMLSGALLSAGVNERPFLPFLRSRNSVFIRASAAGDIGNISRVQLAFFDPFPTQVFVPGEQLFDDVAAVPLPASAAFLLAGLAGLFRLRKGTT